MRFFNTSDVNKLFNQIIGEMINTTYGDTYFDTEGQLLAEKLPNHNTYYIDSVEYSIFPNYGIVHVFGSNAFYEDLLRIVEVKFFTMLSMAIAKFGISKNPIYHPGTTQYLGISVPSLIGSNGVVKFRRYDSIVDKDVIPTGIHFLWNICGGQMPVSYYTKNNANAIYSLSSIVVDLSNNIQLPNGFRSPDYPSYADYKIYKNGNLLVDPIDYHPNYGIHLELTKHYPNIARNKKKPLFSTLSIKNIKLVKWEWLNFYSANSVIGWDQQITMGLLDTEPSEEVNHRCFVTNAPIYDDCYVFDIIERTIEETIDETQLSKYPDAVVLDNGNSRSAESNSSKTSVESTEGTPDDTSNTSNTANTNTVDDIDAVDNTSEPIEPAKKKKNIKIKVKAKTQQKIIPKVIKRGAKQSTKLIKIKYVKKYDTPKCVLISPYYVHLYGQPNAIFTFEDLTRTKVLVYRTKSPVSVYTAIENSTAPALTKKILTDLYDSAHLKNNTAIEVNDKNIKIDIIPLVNRAMSTNLLVNDNVIMAHVKSTIS